ncbi:amidohydrolase family protein [Rhodohalobacter sp. 8-1]|uniref:amidohydrolase family protein n=1 Tax=Rhodohalobacter sp. 8-1 TaxID=3131972 RepID=UPI0030EB439B
MRLAVFCLMIAITIPSLQSCTYSGQTTISTVISGATLFDGTGAEAVENSILVIVDNRIECVGSDEDCPVPDGAEVVDASGKYITLGLVDAHMHFFQTGFFDSRPDAMDITDTYPFAEIAAYQEQNPERYYDTYVCSGITAVYDVGGMTWSIDLEEAAESNPMAPHVAAAGPLLTPVPGAPFDLPSDRVLVQLDSEETGVKMVQYVSALGSTGVKFWQLDEDNPEYMGYVEAAAEEIERQENQMIAHATTLAQAKAALRNGAKLLVHSVSDVEVDDEFIELALENETIYNPTIIVDDGYLKAYLAAAGMEPLSVTDARGCVDDRTLELINSADQFSEHPQFNGEFKSYLERGSDPQRMYDSDFFVRMNLRKVHEAGIPIVVGTDAGNPGTLHGISIYDEMEAMQEAGISADDLIVAATRNGAMAMQRLDDFGTLEAGKFANLIILDDNPSEDISNMRSLSEVMIKGNFYNQ